MLRKKKRVLNFLIIHLQSTLTLKVEFKPINNLKIYQHLLIKQIESFSCHLSESTNTISNYTRNSFIKKSCLMQDLTLLKLIIKKIKIHLEKQDPEVAQVVL